MSDNTSDILQRLSALEDAVGIGRTSADDDRRLGTSGVARFYNVTTRTIERWVADPELGFPQPLYVRSRKYWLMRELRAFDHARVNENAPDRGRERSRRS